MQAKITERLIGSLKPADKPYSVRDEDLTGLMLRIQPTGTKSWLFDYRNEQGRRLSYRIGSYPGVKAEGARRIAETLAGKVADRIDPQAEKKAAKAEGERAKVATLGNFIEKKYGPWALEHMRRGAATAARLKADFPTWQSKPLSDLNSWLIESWRRERLRDGIKATTVNRQLQSLRAALRKAVSWGVIDAHPLAELKPLKVEDDKRVRFLTDAEETRLRDALMKRETKLRKARDSFNDWRRERGYKELPARTAEFADHIRPLVLLALNTGLRRGELFQLIWSDVDLARAMLTVRAAAAKSGTVRHIPLNTEALQTLTAWQKQTEAEGQALVFPGRAGERLNNITKGWVALCKLAKLTGFRFHDCRHHFASRLVQRGVDLNTVRALLGHANLTMTLRYSHLQPENLVAAVAKLA